MKNTMTLTLGLLLSLQSQAIPLLGETAGTIKNGHLTLYRDHENPKKVYYFPNATKISEEDGIPLFNFFHSGLKSNPANAWAYLSFVSHLEPDSRQIADLRSFEEQNPDVEISVLPIKSSMIGLQTTATNQPPLSMLFTEFNFAKVGGRAEDEIGINAMLNAKGAEAFKAVLDAPGGGKIKFDYCYKIQGYGPNMDATISVDMRRAYDYFEGSHSGGWGWFSWSIRSVTEKLHDERAIEITMNGGDAKQWEILDKVAATITERLFKPELAASPVQPAETNRLFRFGAGHVHKEELKQEQWNWKRRDLEEREFCTSIDLRGLKNHKGLITGND